MIKELNILKNYILYFLLMILVCMVGMTNVMAITYTDIGYAHNMSGVDGSVMIDVTYVTSSGAPLNVNRTSEYYTEVEKMYVTIDNYSFTGGLQYQVEMELPLETLQYANVYTVTGNNGENCLTSYANSNLQGTYPRFNFQCPTTTTTVTITVSNINNDAITDQGTFRWNYIFLRSTQEQISGSNDIDDLINSQNQNTLDIINNQNSNKQDIINNNNQNTNRIINNQNENTEKEIESQEVCSNIIIDKNNIILENKIIGADGQIYTTGTTWGVTDFYSLSNNSILNVIQLFNSATSYQCFYDNNKSFISCFIGNQSGNITIPTNAKYIRFSVNSNTNLPQFELKTCKNGNQALNDSITGLNDSLNDDDSSGATSEASDFFSSFSTNTFGLTSIITAPLNLIQSLTSSTCSELHLPLPYLNNKYLDLPCMTSIYQTHFGSFFTMYQTITYGIIAYWVCVRIFNQVKDFKNPEHDEIEVVDL